MLLFIPGIVLAAKTTVIEPIVSYSNEQIKYNIYNTNGNLNSCLEWQADYLLKTGVAFSIQNTNFKFSVLTLFDLPFRCGNMQDSDWRSEKIKTNFCKGELYSGFGFDLEFNFEYSIRLNDNFCIMPQILITNSYTSFKSKKVTGWCGDMTHTNLPYNVAWNDESSKKVRKYGIDLYNNLTCLYFGIAMEQTWSNIKLGVSAKISPFSNIICIDHHLNKEEGHFYQLIVNPISSKFDLWTILTLDKIFSIHLLTTYSLNPDTFGDFYFGYFHIDNILADENCSLKLSELSFKIGLQIKLSS